MDTEIFNLRTFISAIKVYGPWRVGLELLFIGFFVYMIIRFLRGTRGARLLKGVGFVLIIFYLLMQLVAKDFQLDRIQFLYGKFLLFASFAVVVVFQPEIRRALMKLGETSLFKRLSREGNDDIRAIVETAHFCGRRKIGAVIAIARDTGLGGIAESGTRLDAEVSAALLNTIFWPNSPLHDLGVIVSGGRITHAGVQFPLAESGDLEQQLGSRHRAAVGMSQESDAVVVVVSEESGDISVADRGALTRKLTPDGLRQLLEGTLGREPDVRKPDRDESSVAQTRGAAAPAKL